MKTYKHLWEQLLSDDNIIQGIINAHKGNMKRKELDYIYSNKELYIPIVKSWIINYTPCEHKTKQINDGISAKIRTIVVPTVKEHIIQHVVMNVLKPILYKSMYEHSYSSIPGRGCHKAKNVLKKWINKGGSNIKYCLKIDIKQFFPSVDTTILLHKLNKIIVDSKFRIILLQIISQFKGLPLGFYTSQWFSNFYLTDFDHYVKEILRVKYYIRYADDIVIFHSNKKMLHNIFYSIKSYLYNELRLTVKENWQIFRFHTKINSGRFLDFMGFKFYRNRITLRKSIALRAKRKAKKIYKKEKCTIHDSYQMLSYKGWLKYTDTFRWAKIYIFQYINFRALQKFISKYDKRRYLNVV